MRGLAFTSTALFILLGVCDAAVARPPFPGEDPCCCCIAGRAQISCTWAITLDECMCEEVFCPENAPTVWQEMVIPQATANATSSTTASDTATASSDASTTSGASTISTILSYVSGPITSEVTTITSTTSTDVPSTLITIPTTSDASTLPTPTSRSTKTVLNRDVLANDISDLDPSKPAACCCCDARFLIYTCKMKAPEECICAMVMCPPGASTVWEEPTPTPTS